MKRVFAILLCLLCAMCLLVACGNDEEDGHTHTYKTDAEWTKDAEGHWYEATCECEDAPIRKLAHTDANNDGACDVCNFVKCEHTFAEGYTADCTNHWHAADCGHVVDPNQSALLDKTAFGKHEDNDGDGKCDVCNYIIEDLHNHYYSTEWTTDGEYHWHAALCEHKVEVADKAAHEINAAGYCTVCDAKLKDIDKTDIAAVLAAAIANNYKVVSGSVVFDEIVYDTPTAILDQGRDEVFFVLGNGDSYILLKNYNASGAFVGGEQQYFETLENGDMFGIMIPIGSIDLQQTSADPVKLNGYNYTPGSILAAGYDDTSTLAQTLANLYDLMTTANDDVVKNIVKNYDEKTGKYSFSFEYMSVNATEHHASDGSGGEAAMDYQVYVYFVDVEFTVNDDFVIDLCNFSVESYRNWEMDTDITYDPETNTYEMLSTASPTYYVYEVSQTSGERTFTTIYPKASFVPVDFELNYVTGTDYKDDGQMYVTEEVAIVDTDGDGIVDLVLEPEQFVRLHIGSLVPSTAIPSFMDTSDIQVTYENLNGSGKPWGEANNYQAPIFNSYMNVISFYTIDSGDYLFTIKAGSVEKKIHVTISGEPAPDTSNDTATDFHVKVNEAGAYSTKGTLVATQAGIYTINLPAGLGLSSENGTFVAPGVTYGSNTEGATVVFECWEGREVTYYLGAEAKAWFNVTIDFEAADIQKPVDPSEALTGVYNAVSGAYTGVLTIDGTNKTITFVHDRGAMNYTFTIENGKVVLYNDFGPISSGMASYLGILTIDENNVPVSYTYEQRVYTLTPEGEEPNPNPNPDPEPGDDVTLEGSGTEQDPFVITELGDFVAKFQAGPDLVWYTYTTTKGGFITVTSSFDGETWIKLGTNTAAAAENGGAGTTMSTYAPANTTLYIGIANWDDKVSVDIPFAVSFEEAETDDFSALVGTWYGASTTMFGGNILYTLVINADGTGTLTYDIGYGPSEFEISYIFAKGQDVTIGYANMYNSSTLDCTYDGTTFVCTKGASMDSFTFQTTPIDGDDDDDTGDDNTGDDNTGDITSDPLSVMVEGTHNINGYIISIYDMDGYVADIADAAGDISLSFTFTVTDNGDNTYTLTLTHKPHEWDMGVDKLDEILAMDWTISVDPFKKQLEGHSLEIGEYSVYFYRDTSTGEYIFTVSYSWDTCFFFTYTATDNGDGTYKINQTYFEHVDEYGDKDAHLDAMLALDIVVEVEMPEEDNTLEGEGTYEAPYVIPEEGEYGAHYDGDYLFSYFMYEVAQDGYFTITIVGENPYFQYGTNIDMLANNEGPTGALSTHTFYVRAGQTVYIAIGYGILEEAADVEFSVAFEAFESEDASFLEGTWSGEQAGMWGSTPYTFVIGANGTGTGNYEEMGNVTEFTIDFILVDGENVTIYITTSGWFAQELSFSFTYNEATATLESAAMTLTQGTGDDGDDDEDPITPPPPAEPDGTKNNPYIVGTLPFSFTLGGGHDCFYKLVATEDATIVITYAEGCYISDLPSSAVKDSANFTYTFDVKAGDELVFNPWTTRPSGEYTYTVAVAEPVVTPDPDEPGEGGDVGGNVVTYISEKNGSRYIQFSIDGSTLTVTRSDMTGNFGTGGASTAVFTYVNNGVDSTATRVSGTGCTFVFDENGLPTSIAWNGVEYINFTVVE